jgi:predicted O-methyltransferase YrrM
MIKVLYIENAAWEYDFIINDILQNIDKDVEKFNKNNFNSLLTRSDIIENNILVVNENCKLDDIINVVKYIKPVVIFYLSDESGESPNTNILDNYTKLLFRQHNHKHYNYSKNNHQLLLGYSTSFLNGEKSSEIKPKKMIDRKINCSFIGAGKSDRYHMANVFRNNMKNTNIMFVENSWDINKLPISPQKCFEIYNNSIFVLNGRGNCSLDCFRIYEAIVAGAIPVIVGSVEEITTTFNYNNNLPPFVYDDTWEKVVIKCNELLNNYEKLQQIQDDLLVWWNKQVLFINELILKNIRYNKVQMSVILKQNIVEGFGSIFQHILDTYLYSKDNNLIYKHLPMVFEHGEYENMSKDDWNKYINNLIINEMLIYDENNIDNKNVIIRESNKSYLDKVLNNHHQLFKNLYNNYISKSKVKSYFDKSKINIAIHMRVFTKTDCDNIEIRELFSPNSVSDNFISNIIKQLDSVIPNACFHIYFNGGDVKNIEKYKKDNVILHCSTPLTEDLYHMITSDIFIMAKSALSSIVNYYHQGISIIREKYWHTNNIKTLVVSNLKLSNDQIEKIKMNINIKKCVNQMENTILSEMNGNPSNIYGFGAKNQSERLEYMCEQSLKSNEGNILEIGAYIGNTTNIFCNIARKYNRKVYVIDPWQPGTQNCEGDEYSQFIKNTEHNKDIIIIYRSSSLDIDTINFIKSLNLSFVYVDGLHNYEACLSDIKSVLHCKGIICVDDISWCEGVKKAVYEIIDQYSLYIIRSRYFRECYIQRELPYDNYLKYKNEYICTLYADKYINTYIVSDTMMELFEKRYENVSVIRHDIHNPCKYQYKPKSYYNKSIIIQSDQSFDKEHFNMKLWSLIDSNSTQYLYDSPCVLFCYEWTDLWQHFIQDLIPIIVDAKEFLDSNPNYHIIILASQYISILRDLIGIKNNIITITRSNNHINLSKEIIIFEHDGPVNKMNIVSNVRNQSVYSNINNLIRQNLKKLYPDIINPVEPYILYLSRTNTCRKVSNDQEIRMLDSRIKIFNLEENNMLLYERFKLFYNASMIISPHGGASYHIIACKPSTPFIEFVGIYNISLENIANGIGLKWYPLICPNLKLHNQEIYDVNIEELRKIINILELNF